MEKLKMQALVGDLAVLDVKAVSFTSVAQELSAALMVDAYRGTVDWSDDDNEEVALLEIQSMLEGSYGEFIEPASLAILAPSGQPIAQIACSTFEGEATILFVYTAKANKQQGLATRLILSSAATLEAMGFETVHLYVTDTNPARGLYEKLGFKVLANG